ncbi:hypothetical protein GH714_006095 [Hevea brasiliensis]|uniref:Uncharacterized protein n=1 Tax=Hevea brasiliensis TaxID=3981 RepID=A0A6A6M8C8_HEVBR|nr:hypothetical protein GH714_006095 [Hevea brasiliensis]
MAADQRPFARFRLPWLTAPIARPAAEPQPTRPPVEIIQAPTQPTTTVPAQRPPFRPAGIAPVQSPPPQTQTPQRTEPQHAAIESQLPASPSRARTQVRAASVPPSPSRTTSQPVSPSRAITEARAPSLTRSPSRTAPQPRAASVPPSPTRTSSQSQPTVQTVPQPFLLDSRLASQTSSQPSSQSTTATQIQQIVSQETSQPPVISAKPPPSASQQQEPKPTVSLPLSQATQRKIESKPLPEPMENARETEKGKEVVEKLKREGKTNGPAKEETLKSAISELLTASETGAQAKELLSAAFHPEKKQQENEDKKITSISPSGEHIKTVSSTQTKARNKFTESHQKPSMASGEQVSFHKEIRDDIFKFVHKLGVGQLRYPMDDKPVSIVTIAGENRGASMHVGSEPARKDGSLHIHRGYKLNPDEGAGATTDGEGSTYERSTNPTREDRARMAFVNSNTQGINDSMLFESSVNERNPGVQLVLSHNLTEPTEPSSKPEAM